MTKERKDEEWEEINKAKQDLIKAQKTLDARNQQMNGDQQKIKETRKELKKAWAAVEAMKQKSPAELIIMSVSQGFDDPSIFVGEITELRQTGLGDLATIRTGLDRSIVGIDDEVKERLEVLKREITETERRLYPVAFKNYLAGIRDKPKRKREYEALCQKYHPTAYYDDKNMRKNRKWAHCRALELKQIYDELAQQSS